MRNRELGRVILGLSLTTILILIAFVIIASGLNSRDNLVVSTVYACPTQTPTPTPTPTDTCGCESINDTTLTLSVWYPFVGHHVWSEEDPEDSWLWTAFGACYVVLDDDWAWDTEVEEWCVSPDEITYGGSGVTQTEPGKYVATLLADDLPSTFTCPHGHEKQFFNDPTDDTTITMILFSDEYPEYEDRDGTDSTPPAQPTPPPGMDDGDDGGGDDGGGGCGGGGGGGGGGVRSCPTDGCPTVSCYPVSYIKREKMEDAVDLSIPTKHGLSLELRRVYSSLGYRFERNYCGETTLGYGTVTNWHLYRYDSKIDKVRWRERRFVNPNGSPAPLYLSVRKSGRVFYGTGNGQASLLDVPALCDVYNIQDYDPESPPQVEMEEHVLEFADENGAINYFKYIPESTIHVGAQDSLNTLKTPSQFFTNGFWISEFEPVGDGYTPQSGVNNPNSFLRTATNKKRHTTNDVTLYVLHESATYYDQALASENPYNLCESSPFLLPTSSAPALGQLAGRVDGSSEYFTPFSIPNAKPVVKALNNIYQGANFGNWNCPTQEPDMTKMGVNSYVVRYADGRQLHYDVNGNLIYYDANWRNNVSAGSANHVDDYIQVTWENRASTRQSGKLFKQIKEIAAPDGRKLIFNQLDNSTASCLKSVSLQVGETVYPNLVNYAYVTSGAAEGKLMRVTDQNGYGIQYTYGDLGFSNNTTTVVSAPPTGKDPKLVLKSEYNNGTTYDRVAVQYDYSLSRPLVSAEWLRDNDQNWRKSFTLSTVNGVATMTHGRYVKYDGTDPKNSYDTQIAYNRDPDTGNYTDAVISGSNVSNMPIYKTDWVSGTLLPKTKWIKVGSAWNKVEEYTYQNENSGIARPTQITKYANSSSESALVTTIAYDENFPDYPHTVISPDGRRETYTYTADGKIDTHTVDQRDWSDLQNETYDPVSETVYTYLVTGVNIGLISSVTTTPHLGPTKTVSYTYYDTTGSGGIKGMVHLVTVDNDKITSYTYNSFGQVTSVSTNEGGTTTYTYSTGSGPNQYFPPRLLSVTDPTNQTTYYHYDSAGRVDTVTNPLNQVTTNAYDNLGRLSSVTTPETTGTATTSYTYDVEGNLLTLTDPEDSTTAYSYDEFKRVTSESLLDDVDPIYTISYTYAGGAGGCSSCGGGGNSAIAARTISDGTNEETISYDYDYLGRLTWMQNSLDENEISYNYIGSLLTEINHGNTLWGSHKLKYQYDNHRRLAKEIYPNGRSIEFGYDEGGRLSKLKDPFGFMTSVGYDNDGRLDTISHSTLGTAEFTYDANDRLQRLMLGNGAYTDYGRDSYGRLTSFDIKEAGGNRILKHEWQYDSLGRKSAANGITVTGPNLPSPISSSYDAASRVVSEALNGEWSNTYGYDKAGNRTSVNDGTISRTIGYGTGNRETSVSDNIDPLEYDFKGNVTYRMTLDGAKTFDYTWDAYDRLVGADNSLGVHVDYDYDAMGRLLRRTGTAGENTSITLNYWLGLNKLAEERIVDDYDTEIHRADDEEEAFPTSNGWGLYSPVGGETLAYSTDASRGNVLHVAGSTSANAIIGDSYVSNFNPNGTAWGVQGRRQLGFWIKNDGQTTLQINVYCRTSAGKSTLVFLTNTGTDADVGWCYLYHLANANRFPTINDGNWHYVELDLGALQEQLSGVENAVTHVDGIMFCIGATQIHVDDITLSAGALERSYGFAYTGAQTGAAGAKDINDSQIQCVPSWGRYFYHINDHGTVLATTNGNGTKIGVYEPDFHGNYNQITGYRPDRMGLTSTFFDPDVFAYAFKHRFLDTERGRWLSREPSGLDGPNMYHFLFGNVTNKYDFSGKFAIAIPLIPPAVGAIAEGATIVGSAIASAWLSVEIWYNIPSRPQPVPPLGPIPKPIPLPFPGPGVPFPGAPPSTGPVPPSIPIPLPIPLPLPMSDDLKPCPYEKPEDIHGLDKKFCKEVAQFMYRECRNWGFGEEYCASMRRIMEWACSMGMVGF